jgi:hypothetical protein
VHGLPLMGTGDWNDGMNRVGNEGRGESVWLAWFLCSVVDASRRSHSARGETRTRRALDRGRAGWIAALHDARLGRPWFKRAFFDNGAPLGSSTNDECRIDLIAQAWSVLSGASDEAAFTGPAMAAHQEAPARRAGRPAAAAGATLCQLDQQPGLHPGLPAGRARERRPVLARRRLGADGAGAAGRP